MALTAPLAPDQPLSDLNTTPLIDVMLVLLVMIILSIPLADHVVDVSLPGPSTTTDVRPLIRPTNKISITPAGVTTFNGQAVSADEFQALLGAAARTNPEPEIQFQPDPQAPYDAAAKVLHQIKLSGVSAFGFVGNEQYAAFGKASR